MQTIWKPPINRWMGTDYSKLAVINACRGVLTFAGLTMLDRSGRIPVVTFPTIVTVSSCRKMPALQTNASADTSRQLVQFHVESALSCVEIAIAFWNKYIGPIIQPILHSFFDRVENIELLIALWLVEVDY